MSLHYTKSMNNETKVIRQGTRYALGVHDGKYVIWDMSQRGRPITMSWDVNEAGEREATSAFSKLESNPTASGEVVATPFSTQLAAGERSSNSMATAGGIVGIVGAVLSMIPLFGIFVGLIMGVLAVIFSGIGLSRSDQMGGKGMAVTGLVLGILTVIFKIIPGVNVL